MRIIQSVFGRLSRVATYALAAALLVLVAHGAANAGVCISAGIDEPMRLPGGDLNNAGILRLCLDREFSPVTAIHTASIGNNALGYFTSNRDTSEAPTGAPFMMFVRGSDGSLQLYGYALPASGRMNTYLIQPRKSRDQSTLPNMTIATASLTTMSIPAGAH